MIDRLFVKRKSGAGMPFKKEKPAVRDSPIAGVGSVDKRVARLKIRFLSIFRVIL